MSGTMTKKIRFGAAQAMLDFLIKLMSLKTADLTAKLSGVAGFTGTGQFVFSSRTNGQVSYRIELRGVGGMHADIFVNAKKVATTRISNGRAHESFETNQGAIALDVKARDIVEVHQHGDVILRGSLVTG